MGIGGAMVFNLYRGKEINMWSTHVDLLHTHGEPHTASHKSPQGKSDKEFPLSLLKHSSNVPDGINSICNFCPLRGEGLEAMEVGTYGFIFGNLDLRTCSDPNDMGCKEGRAILCFGFSACAACDGCTCRLFPP
ncbi:unnamed protein product [Prunus armeniaca]|uniref:Uncharacterized protein n=1 Tax=Prunus armeniaca TaxID=36596 RepID=A0A6J5XYG9_PRUAR|nr:unnamed protein product [Prunus armeniaca]